MNANALTEKRREKVIGLLKGMNIKKGNDGNFDKENVYECMQQLCDLYEDSIEELQNSYENEIAVLKDKYQKYDENNDLYISLIMEAKKSSNEIINQAKVEVETILAEGREKIIAQEEELKLLHEGVEQEKAILNEELMAARQAVEAEKLALLAETEAEKEKAAALQQKYNRQMISMDEEFMDIKTNILRTAGKMDALKSKLGGETAFNWDVSYENESVAIPEPEVGVEEILPVVEVEVEPVAETVVEISDVVAEEPEVVLEPVEVEPEIAAEEVVASEEIETPAEPEIEIELEAPEYDFIEDEVSDDYESIIESVPEFVIEPEADMAEETSDTEEFSLSIEDLFDEMESSEEGASSEEETADEISFEDINFEALSDDEDEEVEEISFKGLEKLFKE